MCGNGKSEFNVLLVVARDLTHNPSLYSDVDASVATNALLQIQKGLREANGEIQLNVEIVRPGTLAAFREHLQRAGNGYFHLVHFDMHGKVGTRKGTVSKFAFLFSDPTSQKTRPVPGHTVASILGKHNVPFAVLNSCESARASAADDANLAAQFLKHGFRGTIGMPFKIANSAAAIFLEHFYRALLLGRVSFPVAAAAGRKALRLRPIRPTRYGLQLPLRDHFVAVAYGRHGILDYPTLAGPVFHTTQHLSLVPLFPPKDSPIGREFDILRLERLLLQNRIVYLSGVYGVGKTAFLDYAALMWKSTHFVEAVVSVDFGMQEGLSAHGFSMSILQQLCSQVKSVSAVSAHSDDLNTINETIESILSKINAVVVVEGLETAPIYPIPLRLGANWTAEIAPCLRILVRIDKDTSGTGRCHVIFAHRRLNPHPELEELVGHRFRPFQYNLSGLDMPDAMDLSYRILQASGEDTQQWKEEDREWLVGIIELLKSVPSALYAVLPLQQQLGIPWRSFYSRLHQGLFASKLDLQQVPLVDSNLAKEIHHLSRFIPQSHIFLLCLFSNYWHEAPGLAFLHTIFNDTADQSLKRNLQANGGSSLWHSFLPAFVLDRGYLRLSGNGATLDVHPLFTVIARAFLSDFVTLSNRVALRTVICASLEALWSRLDDAQSDRRLCSANALTAVEFCFKEVPAERWPLGLLYNCARQDLTHLSRTIATLFQERRVQLLGLIPYKLPLLDGKASYARLFCLSLSALASTGQNMNRRVGEQVLELSKKGHHLLSLLTPDDGASDITLYRGHLLVATIMSSLHLGNHAKCYDGWQELKAMRAELDLPLLPNVEDYFRPSDIDVRDFSALNKIIKQLRERGPVLSDVDDADLPRYRLAGAIKFLEATEAHNAMFSRPAPRLCEQEDELECRLDQLLSDEDATVNFNRRPDLIDIEDLLSRLVNVDLRDLPAIPLSEIEARKGNLDALEEAYEEGDWKFTCDQHLVMAEDAIQSQQFEEAERHLDSMELLFAKASAPESLLESLDKCRKRVQRASIAYLLQLASFPPRYFEIDGNVVLPRGPIENEHQKTGGKDNAATTDVKWPSKAQMAEFSAMPRKWWDWWQRYQSQDPCWVADIYANESIYEREATLLDEIFFACEAKDYEEALVTLNRLEALCGDTVFGAQIVDISPLLSVRDCFEVIIEQSRLLRLLSNAIAHDIELSRTLIDQLDCTRPKFCTWATDSMIEGFRFSVEKSELLGYQYQLRREHALTEDPEALHRLREMYEEFTRLVTSGRFRYVAERDILGVRAQALEWLVGRSEATKLWADALAYIDEYLQLSQPLAADYPRMHDKWLNIKATCEWNLLRQSLAEAEDNHDFEECLFILDDMEDQVIQQKATPGMVRSSTIVLGQKQLAFWRDAYGKHCLSCARWIQNKPPESPRPKSTPFGFLSASYTSPPCTSGSALGNDAVCSS